MYYLKKLIIIFMLYICVLYIEVYIAQEKIEPVSKLSGVWFPQKFICTEMDGLLKEKEFNKMFSDSLVITDSLVYFFGARGKIFSLLETKVLDIKGHFLVGFKEDVPFDEMLNKNIILFETKVKIKDCDLGGLTSLFSGNNHIQFYIIEKDLMMLPYRQYYILLRRR